MRQNLDLQVWEAIDQHMDDRRRAIREKKLKEDIEKYRKENPKITEQFADLKRKLAHISEDEWNGIPDIGDYTRHKKNKMEVGATDAYFLLSPGSTSLKAPMPGFPRWLCVMTVHWPRQCGAHHC